MPNHALGVDVKIGYYNHAFVETQGIGMSFGTVTAGALANLRVPQLDQRVTITSTGEAAREAIRIQDIPPDATGRTVQVIALLDIEVTTDNVEELSFWAEADGASGSVAATLVTPPDMPDGFPRNLLFVLDEPVVDCDRVRIYVNVTGPLLEDNTVTLTASALWLGPLQVITTDQGGALEESSAYSVEDGGQVQRTSAGQVYCEPAGAIRTHSGNTVYITRTEAFGDGSGGMDVQQLMASARTTRPILWIPDDSTEHLLHRLTIYGQMTQVGRLVPRGPYVRWEGWQVRESR